MSTQPETRAQEEEQRKSPPRKTRIARLLLPSVDANSALLPSDRWMLTTVREIFSTHAPFRRDVGRAAAFAAATGLLAVAGAALLVAGLTVFPGALAAGGALALAGAAGCGYGAKKALSSLRCKTLPGLRQEIMARYMKMKGDELAGEWSRRAAARKKERAEMKPKPQPPLPQNSQPCPPENPKPEAKPGVAGKLGAWALKTALEKAKKSKAGPDSGPAGKAPPVSDADKPAPPAAKP